MRHEHRPRHHRPLLENAGLPAIGLRFSNYFYAGDSVPPTGGNGTHEPMNRPTPPADNEIINMILRDARALVIAVQRADVIFQAQTAALNGSSQAAVMRARKVSAPSLWRWQKRWQIHGFAGLLPCKPPGRPRSATALPASPEKLGRQSLPGDKLKSSDPAAAPVGLASGGIR